MKASILSLLAAGATATLSLMIGTASADCLVEGDMMFVEGQSYGHLGLECLNSTHYDATDTVCGPDGAMIQTDAVYACPTSDPEFDPDGLYSFPFCVQCGPRGPGAALCLSSPDLPSECVGVEDDDGDDGGGEGNDEGNDDDDEGFLPQTTSPASIATSTSTTTDGGLLFDQCEDDADVAIWIGGGGEAGRPAASNYCSREYEGGCYLDAACIANCFAEKYGYTAECAACFGSIPTCGVDIGCSDVCMNDSLSDECVECNLPCVAEFNECTGLPNKWGGSAIPAPTYSPLSAPAAAITSAPISGPSLAPTMPPSLSTTNFATPTGGTPFWVSPTIVPTPTVGTSMTSSPMIVTTSPQVGTTTASPVPTTPNSTASPVPAAGPSLPNATRSSAPKAGLVVALISTTGMLTTLLFSP